MSLTSYLRHKNSPLRHIFDKRLPNLGPVAEQIRKKVKRRKTLLPDGEYSPYEYRLIGTAFDYRARLYFKKYPLKDTVAYQGAQFAEHFGNGFMAALFKHWVSPNYNYWLKQMRPKGEKQRPSVEKGLLEKCILLARYDEIYRAPGPALQNYEGGQIRGIEDMANRTRPEYISDLRRLSTLFHRNFEPYFKKRAVLNPTFEGSGDVGGADADLIIGRQLIDLKCTINPKLPMDKLRQTIYQLIGYVMLDYNDDRKIEEVAVYYARQGVLWSSPVKELLHELSGGEFEEIEILRDQFRQKLRKAA